MGWTFHDLGRLPDVHEIVWCKWPQREDKMMPGPTVRPVLVRETRIMELIDGTRYGALLVAYGTGQGINAAATRVDLCIYRPDEVKAAGLHKATRFSLSPRDQKLLPWCQEHFLPPEYVRNLGIVLGRLSDSQRTRLTDCLRERGLMS
jgi:hypothetical protein